ncbi:MAG: hypothetical protein HS100_16095 [Anaerolineales bacterium]|nr:hypothetical protein [Anaerolineales bacterium]
MTDKYLKLEHFLRDLPPSQNEVTLSFEQVERIIGNTLPPSAYKYQAWWANSRGSHVEAEAWLNAGWRVETVNLREKWVRFVRAG